MVRISCKVLTRLNVFFDPRSLKSAFIACFIAVTIKDFAVFPIDP